MSDETVDLNNKAKAAMRQRETPLSSEPRVVRSPNSTPNSATKTPKPVVKHKTPY
jgi:hypothetical protein